MVCYDDIKDMAQIAANSRDLVMYIVPSDAGHFYTKHHPENMDGVDIVLPSTRLVPEGNDQ